MRLKINFCIKLNVIFPTFDSDCNSRPGSKEGREIREHEQRAANEEYLNNEWHLIDFDGIGNDGALS